MRKVDHSKSQIDLPLNVQVLNIAVNLSRLSKWVYEDFDNKANLIDIFMKQTEKYLADLDRQKVSEKFMPTLERVKKEFLDLKRTIYDQDRYSWAEDALTWANILTHRAKLA